MYEGMKEKGKIDPEFEYSWYMEAIDLHCEGVEDRAREILWGMFRGVLRFVTGYRWLEECPTGIDLTGISVTAVAQQNEAGKNHHDILGNWDIIFTFTPCEDGSKTATSRSTLMSIERSMERFVRSRYDLKEPTDLSLLLLEQQRKELVEKHFTGVTE